MAKEKKTMPVFVDGLDAVTASLQEKLDSVQAPPTATRMPWVTEESDDAP